MLRPVLMCLLVACSAPAFAVYKCKMGNDISYSDQPCPGGGGQVLAEPEAPADAAVARRQAELEKKQARQLENTRRRQELQEDKERQRAAHEHEVKQKRCRLLAQRKKWADEDLSAATGRSAEKARVKARRVGEQLELECGKVASAG